MFQGASSLSLDAKGRLSVPTRHRDVLSATAGGLLTLTKHPHGCLMVFPRPEWEKFRERVATLPMSAQWWKRIFLGNAMDVEMDTQMGSMQMGMKSTKTTKRTTADAAMPKKAEKVEAPKTGPDAKKEEPKADEAKADEAKKE